MIASTLKTSTFTTVVAAPRTAQRRQAAPGFLLHFFPSLTDVAFLAPIILILKLRGLSFLIGDGDTGWHLKAGEWMIQNGRVPVVDLFSFTKPGAPWFAWEWLWDVVFGWLNMTFGLNAVVLATLLLICLTSALVYRIALRACSNPVVAMVVTLAGMIVSSVHWLARPHIVTLLFAATFFVLLERVRAGKTRHLIALPLLTILWTNLHGGFFVGIVMTGAYAGGEFCAWLLEPDNAERRAALHRGGQYLLTAAACAIASLLNPYGYKVHQHIFQYLTDKGLLLHISEFQSLDFHHPVAPFFALLLLSAAGGVFWHAARKRYTWTILLAGWGWLALVAARNIPIFVICAAAPISVALVEMLQAAAGANIARWALNTIHNFHGFAEEISVLEKPWRVYLTSAAVFILLATAASATHAPDRLRAEFNSKDFPVQAVDTVLARTAPGRVFTNDLWGGYLIYRLYPTVRVFVDGRSDFYGTAFGEQWTDILNARQGWEKQLNKFGVDTVMLPVRAPLVGALKESHTWKPIYDDGATILFRSPNQNPLQASAKAAAGVIAGLRKPQPFN